MVLNHGWISSTSGSLPKCPQQLGNSDNSVKPETWNSIHISYLDHHLLTSRIHISSTLESEVEQGIESRHSDTGGRPKWRLNCHTNDHTPDTFKGFQIPSGLRWELWTPWFSFRFICFTNWIKSAWNLPAWFLVYKLDYTLRSLGVLKNTDGRVPSSEILIYALCGAIWTSEFVKTPQVILVLATFDDYCYQ